ncbi:MAG: PKD domain-containing protein, partial [Bacteroidales bacterium]|nr:PKD domain-containing protein [Bacteroidales bacterium]
MAEELTAQTITANFTYTQDCKDFQFTDASASTGGDIISWDWEFGDGGTSTLEDPPYTYAIAGDYEVTLIVTHETLIIDTYIEWVSIVEPTAAFDFLQTCDFFEFTDQSIPDDGTIDAWEWDFGDLIGTSNQQNPTYTYPNEGDFTVSLTVTHESGCQDVVTQDVSYYLPKVAFSISPECEDYTFTDLTTLTSGRITDWAWDFGDGIGTSIIQNPLYTYLNPGEYTVSLTVTTLIGCQVSADSIVSFYYPIAGFSYDNICGDFEFQNESTVADGELTYFWDFDDGNTSTDENP